MEEEFRVYKIPTELKENTLIKKIIAVRHGESVANTKGIYQGQTYDTDLSDLGKKQAIALAQRLKEVGIRRIITSPLKRTYQTALEVSKVTGVPVELNEDILETNHGLWEGHKKNWIEKNFPEIYMQWQKTPGAAAFPGGETFEETYARVNHFLSNLEIDDGTLIVTHDNIVRILANLAYGFELNDIWMHTIEPASLNFFEITKSNGKKKLNTLKLNDNRHLENLRTNLTNHAL